MQRQPVIGECTPVRKMTGVHTGSDFIVDQLGL